MKKYIKILLSKWMLKKPLALPLNRDLGNPRKEYSWADWRIDNKKAFPIRYWLQEELTLWFAIKWRYFTEAWYWIRTHTYNRYHILDLRHPGFYEWGWIDVCRAILPANFNLLKNFVEKEKALNCHINWEAESHHAEAKKEIAELYTWWTIHREKEWDNLDIIYKKYGIWMYSAEGRRLEKKDDEMLIRLIKIRQYLWT